MNTRRVFEIERFCYRGNGSLSGLPLLMKIKSRMLVMLFALVLLLASCATTVSIPYTMPSEVNMGRYRNLAVASTVPYRGYVSSGSWIPVDAAGFGVMIHPTWGSGTAASVASYATDQLWSTLSSSGYYNLLSPSQTDAVLYAPVNVSRELRRMGYDAVMIPRIDAMNVDENIYSVQRSATEYDAYDHSYYTYYYYDYYIKQTASITYTISVIDTNTEKIIATRTFTDSRTNTESIDPDFPRFDKAELLFQRMIRSFDAGIIRLFVPTMHNYSWQSGRDHSMCLQDSMPLS